MEETKFKKKSFYKSFFMDILELILIIAAALAFNFFVIMNATIPSESMETTIMVNDRIIGNRLAFIRSDPKRYDIVIFKYPDDPSVLYVKRVIGLPGDKIDIRDGLVYVNDSETPLTDSFCPVQAGTEQGNLEYPIIVPPNCFFMLGDNRLHSHDSRYWQNTFVRKDQIVAKAWLRYWPLNQIKLLNKGNSAYYQPPKASV